MLNEKSKKGGTCRWLFPYLKGQIQAQVSSPTPQSFPSGIRTERANDIARKALGSWAYKMGQQIGTEGGMMKTGSRSQLELILFLFRIALRGKKRAPRRLQGFSQLFSTPGEDRFCRDTFQRFFDDVRSSLRNDRP